MISQTPVFVCILCISFIKPTSLLPVKWNDNDVDNIYGVAPEQTSILIASQNSLETNDIKDYKITPMSPNGIECEACKVMTGFIQKLFRDEHPEEFIEKAAKFWCIKLKIEDTRVCTGVIPEFQNEVLTVFDQVGLNPDEICGLILGPSCSKVRKLYPKWNVTFPNVLKPPVNSNIQTPKANSPVYKIIQLSDVHIDHLYAENTSTKCGEPLCCREYNGKGEAGYWGSYPCDIPMRTFEATLKHIKENHADVDLIYWTGDVPPHNIWNQSRNDQLDAMSTAMKVFLQYFPNVTVYPAMGNHESAPVNSFPPPFVHGHSSNKWLLDGVADLWSVWLPEDTLPSMKKGGYYTVLHSEGFRIVSLNDNYCNNQNWWLLINNTDPAGELQWLIDVLQAAEDKKEKVHIISHMPVGTSTCLKQWSWNYYKIIDRYESTVAAQFFGHTHQDHFELFYDLKDITRATNIAYIGPSVTTYPNLNPGYRVYEVDGKYPGASSVVLDHSTYIVDLASSTKDNLVWKHEYSAKDTYDMKSLLPSDWDDLVTRMGKNQTLFQTYYKYKFKCSPYAPNCTTEACRVGELCDLRSARSYDHSFCRNATIPEYNMC